MVYRQETLDSAFGALADGTRRAILAQLARGDRSISELARNFDITLPAVSKHVRVLERAGLTVVRRDGRSRMCHLVAAPLQPAAAWIGGYRRFWEEAFDRVADYLDDTLTPETPACLTPKPGRPPRRSPSRSGASSRPRGRGSSRRGARRTP